MAQAIARLYPGAKFAYGPATDNGFYYDVDLGEKKISEDDFPAIEDEMKKICKENLKFTVYEKPREEAVAFMAERGQDYKVEHIADLPEDAHITFYQQGEYVDMCVGPHLMYTKALKAFKLTAVSGAYWKGDKDNKMLTRINGVAFRNKQEMDAHFAMLAEAEKRDHRKIGKEMELFMFSDFGPGFPFWLPNGMKVYNALKQYWIETTRSSSTGSRCRTSTVTSKSTPRSSCRASSGRPPATGTTTKRTCTPPRSTTRTSPSSR